MSELTVKEALDQGYTHYTEDTGEWGFLYPLEEMEQIDFKEGRKWVLANKEGVAHSVTEEEISELLADIISDEESCESNRDDDEIYNAIKALDFKPTVDMINKALEQYKVYKLTDIKLIPNPERA